MRKLTDHALFDIELTQDEIYKIRLAVSRELDKLCLNRKSLITYGLSHEVEDHLIPRYCRIMDKLNCTENAWLDRGRFHLRFIFDRWSENE